MAHLDNFPPSDTWTFSSIPIRLVSLIGLLSLDFQGLSQSEILDAVERTFLYAFNVTYKCQWLEWVPERKLCPRLGPLMMSIISG